MIRVVVSASLADVGPVRLGAATDPAAVVVAKPARGAVGAWLALVGMRRLACTYPEGSSNTVAVETLRTFCLLGHYKSIIGDGNF